MDEITNSRFHARSIFENKISFTYMETFRNIESKNSLYIAIEINRLSLNSEGAFRTTIHSLIPQARNRASTEKTNTNKNFTFLQENIPKSYC